MRERVRKKLVVPDLMHLRTNDAQIMLTNHGFNQATIRFVESYDDIDTVVSQEPLKGQLVDSSCRIEVQVAKQSYLRYLPQIYQVDSAIGTSFIREFLWVFQHIVESITDPLSDGYRFYDPRECPEEFLPWLASWVALTLDVDWPEAKKRKMIQAAASMYRYRGTRRALEEVLSIFVGVRPVIEENSWPYKGFRIDVSSMMGEDSLILPTINLDHCFIVRFPMGPDELTEETVVKIHQIINTEKPAHTTYFLQFDTEGEVSRPQTFMQIGTIGIGVMPPGSQEMAEQGGENRQ